MCTDGCITIRSHYRDSGEIERLEVTYAPQECRVSTQFLAGASRGVRGDGLTLWVGWPEEVGYRITGISDDLQWVSVEKL